MEAVELLISRLFVRIRSRHPLQLGESIERIERRD